MTKVVSTNQFIVLCVLMLQGSISNIVYFLEVLSCCILNTLKSVVIFVADHASCLSVSSYIFDAFFFEKQFFNLCKKNYQRLNV